MRPDVSWCSAQAECDLRRRAIAVPSIVATMGNACSACCDDLRDYLSEPLKVLLIDVVVDDEVVGSERGLRCARGKDAGVAH